MLRRNGDGNGPRADGKTGVSGVMLRASRNSMRRAGTDRPAADGAHGAVRAAPPVSRDAYSACSFHLPSTICTITRARVSKPL